MFVLIKFPNRAIRSFKATLAVLTRRLGRADSGSRYRPEKHYMRGHGPKSQLRRSQADTP